MIQCSKCQSLLPKENLNTSAFTACPGCRSPLRVLVFPALFRPVPVTTVAERLIVDKEAGCYYHPQNKAVVPCASCGRFLCSVCDIDFNEQHICPQCLESGAKKKKVANIENECKRYDQIAFGLATYSIFLFYLTFITAPIALYMAIRHWRGPVSILSRNKAYLVAAIILSLLQIGAWVAVIFYFAHLSHDKR